MRAIQRKVKTCTKLVLAFAIGQITQLVLQAVVVNLNMWDSRRVLFCAAAGFVILFAVIMGVRIAVRDEAKEKDDGKM